MLTRKLGSTDVIVNAIGLGAMPLSLPGHPDEESSLEVIKTFIELGGDFIDTANVYCPGKNDIGHNERLISKALKQLDIKDEVKVATKGGLRRLNDNWSADASPMWLRISCENSLTDLNQRSIFLYQLHAPDPDIPLSDSIGELVRLKNEGLIEHIGLSNVGRKQIKEALEQTDIMSVQNRCSLFQKDDLVNGTAPFCHENNITYICHSPVGGHYRHKELMKHKSLMDIAEKHGTSPYVISLAWLIQHDIPLLPIPGASKVRSVQSSMLAHEIEFTDQELEELDKL